MSQYFEQGNVYNAMNFSVNVYTPQNATVSAIGQSMLWCPERFGDHQPEVHLSCRHRDGHTADDLLFVVRRQHGSVVPVVRA